MAVRVLLDYVMSVNNTQGLSQINSEWVSVYIGSKSIVLIDVN